MSGGGRKEEMERFLETSMLRMENGEKAPRLFSDAEYERRLKNIRLVMEEKGISASVLTSIHNVAYFSNFIYCAFGRPYCVVITHDKVTTVSALIDAGQPWRRSYQDNVIFTDWKRDNFYKAVRSLVGGTKGKVGVEMDHINMQAYRKLDSALDDATLVDIGEAAARQRMIKSSEEIDVIKLGAATAEVGGAACWEALGEGVPEYEVALAGQRAMVRHIAEQAGDRSELMDTWVWFQSGINTDGAHNPVTTKRIKMGDCLSLNCFPMIQGYYTALERTWFLGSCDPASLKLWEANVAVHKRGLELIKPGATCADIAEELNSMLMEMGLLRYRAFGYGHSFGVLCHYYGREAGLEIREDIHTVIEPGMVVSMEPMLTIPQGIPGAGGYREHDIVVVHEDGNCENITKYPFGPEHNIKQ